ncbi:peptidase [Micromonospora echinofusca]|uniref:Peptidase n=1 Tax=Micromonospora echinofusca TaxID=47858 RepID=A0ABS3VN75_MICEH|nr:peptidase [Micromonospora echinofusca]MBO4205990.1 peptidase [Micromonospora echinofusca]
MGTPTVRRLAALLAATGLGLLPAGAALADPSPSPGAATVTKAGTSFLTATAIAPGQPVRVGASHGEYLYWTFPAAAGEVPDIGATVSYPAGRARTGAATWTIDVFDGLRRRQACTAGAQTPTVPAGTPTVQLGCTLRTVRAWAEPWSGDPLPGTYYIRLSVTGVAESDLGLPLEVELLVGTDGDGDGGDGSLAAPLVPPVKAGKVLTDAEANAAAPEEDDGYDLGDWLPAPSSRWIWTTVGGILAAVAGVVGFGLTRRR